MRTYVASSWRNTYYPGVLETLRAGGHEPHDFRDPAGYFTWAGIDPAWEGWTTEEYIEALGHPNASVGFDRDFAGMTSARTCVLVLPCGRSAHLEAGWFIGADRRLVIYIPERIEPELMYRMADAIVSTPAALLRALAEFERRVP
jgi:hypothetical protein